jgi:hypothetical protein
MLINGSVASIRCLRDLHRENLSVYGAELQCLIDPSLIPRSAVAEGDGDAFHNLGSWLSRSLGTWSQQSHGRLGLDEAFEKYDLSEAEQNSVLREFQESPEDAYRPGIQVIEEIHRTVPVINTREGAKPESWEETALQSRLFGSKVARDGSGVQSVVRDYLYDAVSDNAMPYFDAGKLKADPKTGITTVTNINLIIALAQQMVRQHLSPPSVPGICIGLQSASPCPQARNAFDATWNAYTYAAGRFIYPSLTVNDIPSEQPPDDDIEQNLMAIVDSELVASAIIAAIISRKLLR